MKKSMCMISSRALEVGLTVACASYAGEVISWLAEKEYLSVTEEEVLSELGKLGAASVVSARSAAMKKVRKCNSKKSASKEECRVKGKPEMLLPFCGVVEESWCKGIRYNHGLHSQCTNGAVRGGKYCTTCAKSAKNSASGKPTYGDISDRMEGELLAFRDQKGKQTQCYANVAAKLGLDIKKAQDEANKMGWRIPEDQLSIHAVKRGRPSVSKVVKAKGKRGRPVNEVVKSTRNSMDEQIAQLVAEAAEDVVGEVAGDKKSVVRKSADEKAAEKAAKKADKEAEKEAKKAAKKAAKEAEKEAKKAAKEAEKEAKKAAKEAEKEAKKAAKAAEKDSKQPNKTELKKKELQKKANEIGCEISDEKLVTLKIGEIRSIIKERKECIKNTVGETTKVEEVAETTKVEEVAETTKVEEVAETTKVEEELVLDEEPIINSDDDEDEDEISIDPETTPTVVVDGVEYYRITYCGQEDVLISMDGDMVGVYDEENNEIMDIEIDDE